MTERVPTFSVIIITHDRPELLMEAVASVIAQTLPAHEIIVVDDGSTVDLSSLLDKREAMRLIRQENSGQQAARNRGAQEANGTWLVFLDDDDKFRPDHLATLKSVVEIDEPDVIFTNFTRFFEAGCEEDHSFYERAPGFFSQEQIEAGSVVFQRGWPLEKQMEFYLPYPSATAVRRDSYFRFGGFDPRVRGVKCEDLEFTTRITRNAHIAFSLKPTMLYRSHSGNSVGDPRKQEVGQLFIWDWLLRSADLTEAERALIETRQRERARAAFWAAWKLRDREALTFAKNHMSAIDRLHPKCWLRAAYARLAFVANSCLPEKPLRELKKPGFAAATLDEAR